MSEFPHLLNAFRADVRAMQSYVVQDATGFIKLDAMENPFILPHPLQVDLGQRLGSLALNRYPANRIKDLHSALRTYAQLPNHLGLVLGNGSDELISMLSVACAQEGAVALAPLPSFVMYDIFSRQVGMKFVGVDLTATFELDMPAMLAAIVKHKPALTYIAYPNNPTANLWPDDDIEQIVQAVKDNGSGFVVIDEAYQPFAQRNYLDRMLDHPHVLLMRTLSKFGLAGVRLGYMTGYADFIEQIEKVRPPYNVSILNCEAALFALEHADEFERQAQVIIAERERLQCALANLSSVQIYPSQANMILLRVPDAAHVFSGLKSRGILIKNMSGQHHLLSNCIRLTVGTPAENDALIAAMCDIL